MKTLYRVYSGKVPKTIKPLVYQFGRTPDIYMTVSKNGFTVEVSRSVKKEGYRLLDDLLIRDAIRKAARIQLIRYGAISVSSIYAEINGKKTCLYDSTTKNQEALIYSLCGNSLYRKLSTFWEDDAIKRVLSVPKSRTDRRDAALDALLVAKAKEYETEKFIYLWMSMNGLYGYAAEIASKYMKSKREQKWINREYAQIKFFAMLNGYAYCFNNEQEAQVVRKLENLLGKIAESQIESLLEAVKTNEKGNVFVVEIITILKDSGIAEEAIHPYAVLLLYLSYKIRCKYFHAEKGVPLICFKNEHPLPVLRMLNVLLEDYIDNNLHKWFDEKLFNERINPCIIELASNCICDKSGRLSTCIVNGEEKA